MAEKESKLNFVFWGTPEVAKETLDILKKSGYLPALIITSTDKPKGRKMIVTPPPVKVWAKENEIPFIQPEKIDPDMDLSKYDLSIVVAYGKILPEKVLNSPRLGSINIHYSLLPKYRGASPVESAILMGEKETGVSIQKMVFKMDAGPIIAQEATILGEDETALDLRRRLTKLGGDLLLGILPKFTQYNPEATPQKEEEATFCKKIKKEDGLIDPNGNDQENYNKFRAYFNWPRIFFFKNGKRIIITKARMDNGKFVIEKIIPEGGKETEYAISIWK